MAKAKKNRKRNFIQNFEMQEILANKNLLKRIKRGSKQGQQLKGKLY